MACEPKYLPESYRDVKPVTSLYYLTVEGHIPCDNQTRLGVYKPRRTARHGQYGYVVVTNGSSDLCMQPSLRLN